MKMFKIYALALSLLVLMVSCGKDKPDDNGGNNNQPSKTESNLDMIEKEWKLVLVNDVEPEFTVYMAFEAGLVTIYQQVYSLNYVCYEGDYSIDGDELSGCYLDGSLWKSSYIGSISDDGMTLTLLSKETNPMTCVYEECVIPQIVIDEATTRANCDIVYHL